MTETFDDLSFMPQMESAFDGWTSIIEVQKITQVLSDGDITASTTTIDIDAVIQPLMPEEISFKPEGQRHWAWWQLHEKAKTPSFTVNDLVVIGTQTYKVMARKNYSLNGYIEYHIIEEYMEAST